MSFTCAAATVANLFRVSYEATQALFQPSLSATSGIGERIERVIAANIALVDAFFTIGEYTHPSLSLERFRNAIIPLRLLAIGQGIYRLAFDANRDPQCVVEEIFLHSLNVSSFAMRILQRRTTHPSFQHVLSYASSACLLADTTYRISFMFLHRAAIADRISNLYHRPLFDPIKQAAYFTVLIGDIVLRTVLHIALAIRTCGVAIKCFALCTYSSSFSVTGALLAMGTLACSLTVLIGMGVHKTLNDLGFQDTLRRVLIEGGVATVAATCLTMATAVGLGLADSISDVFKASYPSTLIIALSFSLIYLFKKAFDQIHRQLGIQQGPLIELSELSFSILSSLSLTSLAGMGFGLTKTAKEPLIFMLRSFGAIVSYRILLSFASLMGRLLISGPLSWRELLDLSCTLYI